MWGAGALAALQVFAGALTFAPDASAVLNSPNAQIARSVDAALRRSIPAFNPEVKELQTNLEEVAFLLRIPQRKPYGTMASNVERALGVLDTQRARLLDGVPLQQRPDAEAVLDKLYGALKQLQLAIKTQQPDFCGVRVADALKAISQLELLQAPGLAYSVPKDYAGLPRLVGRAVVSLRVEKADGSAVFVDAKKGGVSRSADVEITLDGYSAPITAGNFLVNVLDGKYNNRKLVGNYTAVIAPTPLTQTTTRPPIPLEILPLGEFDPVYRLPLDVQSGELPVLPLSLSGAVAMGHLEGESSYVSGDEWFVYKFDKQQAGLAGLAFDEGTFGVFGYVTKGMDAISLLRSGDLIVSATVVSGAEKLVQPQPAPPPASS
eukprot:CAMPEP_0202859684 /NCGR_PEP_ID=MMETSP1391-20130828/1691_1 /ASSEMBLY_ACC=CAM_ASM_000867 /TAXON_ID=1034604 /ORGANISM="Chlamydomonas leiostraca, Strain SAG 11-49" /LENGTH=376 /DNA_ID=CAMNT_0049538739 /DNA_START=202 /DNA_END=1332 /DNA_ORIENTATION=+